MMSHPRRWATALARFVKGLMGKSSSDTSTQVDWRAIVASPEFSQIDFHPLAGKIVGDKQFFFEGSFTTFPWGTEDMHKLIEQTQSVAEPQEIVPFLKALKQLPSDAVVFELGAGWAFYSLVAGRALAHARLVLLEAHPNILEITKSNIARNGLSERATLIQAAASDRDGQYVNFSEAGYGSRIKFRGPYRVPTVSVDGLMRQLNLSHVHLVHMDVQGAEEKVLLGMREALQHKVIDYIFIGTHSNQLHIKCENLLKLYGYQVWVSLNSQQSVSIDGILIGARPGITLSQN